jgi:hypothetical protein
MPDLYQHNPVKYSDAGIQLRTPPDAIPANQYSRLNNALPVIEGRLETRGGLSWIMQQANATTPGSGIHTVARLNQPSISTVGDRIIGADTTVQTLVLPGGSVPIQRDTGRTGDPLSLPQFHFNNDTSAWAIISDRAGMKKYRGGSGAGLYQQLGVQSPLANQGSFNPFGAASAVAGGAGNLNSTGGPGYDWVYTYVNSVTNSESNPSPAFYGAAYGGGAGPIVDITTTVNTSPDPNFGGSVAFLHGANSGTLNTNSATEGRQSVLWTTFGTGTPPYIPGSMYLFINCTFGVTPNAGGCVYGAIYFSLDGGNTWKLAIDSSTQLVFQAIPVPVVIALPTTVDATKVQVRAVALSVGNTTTPQNVIARRIRDRGGNFPITDLLTGGGGNTALSLSVSNIYIMAVTLGTAVTTLALTNQSANVTVNNPIDPQVDSIRLYRRGGSVTASWAFVGQFSLSSLPPGAGGGGTSLINDNVADTNLGNFVSLTNDMPVTSVYALQRPLPYVWGPGLNPSRLFGCGDPDRPDAVYFSNAGNADQWGSPNWVDVSSPSDKMQNGTILDTRVFAFSKERMFELAPSLVGGSTITPYPTPCSRGLISPWGLWPRNSATCKAIYFVAKDGIYVTNGGPEQSLVENDIKPIFPTLDLPARQVGSVDAVNMERIEDIRLGFHNDELYFIYRGLNSGFLQMLIFDQNKSRWRQASYGAQQIAVIYSEEAGPASSLLLGDTVGNLYTTQTGQDSLNGSTAAIAVNVRTGSFDQGIPLNLKEYGSVLFDIDPGGATALNPIVITPIINAELLPQAAINVTGTGRQQVPLTLGDIFGFNLSFDITWNRSASINPVLFQLDILWRPEPSSLVHWEARESSYGLSGFGHARDAYFSIRSNSAVTLTLTMDGTVQTYTIPSTGGQRRKQLVTFNANKWKVMRIALDAVDGVSQFRLYPDGELRVKQWITSLGYQPVPAFGAESTAVTQAFESTLLGGAK